MLPEIRKQARFACRALPIDAREELVQEVIATSYQLFRRLTARGKVKLAYPTPLAQFAIKHAREGRRMGSRRNSQDVTSPSTLAMNRVAFERLDRLNPRTGRWREVLIEDRTAGPAEIAAARIDWADWLRSMSRRQRAIAGFLAIGETTGAAAKQFQLSPARISQLRLWFQDNWLQFQDEERSASNTSLRT
jgi:hypothetical protein